MSHQIINIKFHFLVYAKIKEILGGIEFMDKILIKECGIEDIEKIKDVSEKTFYETFFKENTKEDMENYLKENFSYSQIESEIRNSGSKFYIAENSGEVVAYMKLNLDKTQTESEYDNTLEVQRIYVLKEYKGKQIGKLLMQKAIEVGKSHNFNYLWLGVWENNINAIKFYEKLGFEKFDTHIFKLGEDEQIDNLMKLIL